MGNRSSAETELQSAENQASRVSNQEANNFIQNVFRQNEELGFIPLRLLGNGTREVQKANMNKAKAVELPFDIKEGSIGLFSDKKGLTSITFDYQSSSSVDCKIYFGAKEKRSEDDYNLVLQTRSEHPMISCTLPAEDSKSIELSSQALWDEVIRLKQNAIDKEQVLIVFQKQPDITKRKEITKLYFYCFIALPETLSEEEKALKALRKNYTLLVKGKGRP